MVPLRARLVLAIQHGALLSAAMTNAGCAGRTDTEPRGQSGASAGGSASGGQANAGTGNQAGASAGTRSTTGGSAGGPNSGLPLYPSADYPVCAGPEREGGYSGQCCVEPHCFTPEAGAACPPAAEAQVSLPHFPPGSGECSCYPEGQSEAVQGPYRSRPEGKPVSNGECCYLVGSIGCEGRPLFVGGAARMAKRTPRADWTSRPSWAY